MQRRDFCTLALATAAVAAIPSEASKFIGSEEPKHLEISSIYLAAYLQVCELEFKGYDKASKHFVFADSPRARECIYRYFYNTSWEQRLSEI